MKRPSRLDLIKLWLNLHPAQTGLYLAVTLMFGVAAVRYLPIGPPTRITGVVERLGVATLRRSAFPIAYVRLARREVVVRLPEGHACAVGSPIAVTRQTYLWGDGFDADWTPCAPSSPG